VSGCSTPGTSRISNEMNMSYLSESTTISRTGSPIGQTPSECSTPKQIVGSGKRLDWTPCKRARRQLYPSCSVPSVYFFALLLDFHQCSIDLTPIANLQH